MKKILFGISFILFTAVAFAQSDKGSKINEGIITYTVEWKLPQQMQAIAANFPKELTVYFKGDSSSLKTQSPMYSSTNILNLKKDYERLLLDIPMAGKKISVRFTPEDLDQMQANMPELTSKPGSETKSIAGYTALKYEMTESKSNQNFEAWFTKDAEIIPNSLSRFFDQSLGFPLEFTTFMNGLSLKAVVKEIKSTTVPAGSFSASADYEEMTFQQLMQMQRGR